MLSFLDKICAAGVVGAGGAGFPSHAKLSSAAKTIIANGAECEPLLRVDQQMMELYAAQVVEGVRIAMRITGAKRGVICLKAKYKNAVHSLEEVLKTCKHNISLLFIGNYYPAGDEQALVYEATRQVVPVGGIPIMAGAVVLNVSTLVNIAQAVEGIPVTHKYVTVTGEVGRPLTVQVPIGTSARKLVEYAGGPQIQDGYSLILGGLAMGAVAPDWDVPVTKTLGGLIVLPSDHSLIQKKTSPLHRQIKLGKAACCQCSYCTQMCPRAALGLGTSPHKVMRAVAYGTGVDLAPEQIISCCECGVCTYFACPMGLTPSRIMGSLKSEIMRKRTPFEKKASTGVSADREYGNLPVARLVTRLGIKRYDVPAPMEERPLQVGNVRIPLKQHIGAACAACVETGQQVTKGDLIGNVPEGQLGASVHASISGTVTSVSESFIEIQADGGKE